MTLVHRLRAGVSTPPRLFAALALWLSALAVWRPLAVPDEGRYTDVARWMLRSGDWLVPRLDGLPFLHKPPLYYWLEAATMAVAGVSPWTARAASLLAAWLACLAAYALVRRLVDERSARWTALLLMTNPLLVLGAQYANLDMLVAACITGTITLAALACHARPPAQRWLWWGAYAVAALGVLAKGLIGVVLPGAVFVLWALLERQPRRLLAALSAVGLIVLALIALPWFMLAEQRVPGLLHFFFVVQQFERYTEAGFNNAWGPWFYPAIVAVGLLPWSLVAWPALRQRSPAGLAGRQAPQQASAASLRWLGLAWFAVVMVFFSIPRSKLVGYIFPLLPAVGLLLGPWVARWRWRWHLAGVGALSCVGLVVAITLLDGRPATRLAATVKPLIGPTDAVVLWDRYDYAVPVVLDRTQPLQVVSDWSRPSRQLPDNWRRELMEGREFEPAAATQVLMSRQEWALQRARHPVSWVWAERDEAASDPLLRGWPVVAREGKVVVLKVSQKPSGD